MNESRMNGGMMTMDPAWGEMPSHWSPYFSVASIEASLEKAQKLGGQVHGEIITASAGEFAPVADPTGANCMLIEPSTIDPWEE